MKLIDIIIFRVLYLDTLEPLTDFQRFSRRAIQSRKFGDLHKEWSQLPGLRRFTIGAKLNPLIGTAVPAYAALNSTYVYRALNISRYLRSQHAESSFRFNI